MPTGSLTVAEAVVYYDVATDTARIPGDASHGKRAYRPGPTEIPGTIDLLIRNDTLTVLDWKMHTDVGSPDENAQVMAYSLAAARAFGVSDVQIVVAYIEADEEGNVRLLRPLVVRQVDAIDLDVFASKLRGILAAVEVQRAKAVPDVRENRHCRHCPAAPHCPAKTALIRRLVSGGERDELELMMPLTPATAAIAWERLGHARALLKRIETALYAFASTQDIPLRNGNVLGKRIKQGNEKLDGAITFQVLSELYGPDVAEAATGRVATKVKLEAALKAAGVKPLAPAMKKTLDAIAQNGGSKRDLKESVDEHTAGQPTLKAG